MPVSQREIAEYLNRSVWSSASRINAYRRFGTAADGGVLIPPDIAAIAGLRLEQEKQQWSILVRDYLEPVDGEVTEAWNRDPPRGAPRIPEGSTYFSSLYAHKMLLDATPPTPSAWVWHDMPQELYLVNDPTVSAEERSYLISLGYGDSASKAARGEQVYTVSEEALALSEEVQAKFDPVTAGLVVAWGLKYLIVVGAVALTGYALYKGVSVLAYSLTTGREVARDIELSKERQGANRFIATQVEETAQLLRACRLEAEAGQRSLDDCTRIASSMNSLHPVRQYSSVGSLSQCGFGQCWPWALATFGVGAFVGRYIAKQKRWGE
jgi:hypothetical protein